MKNKLKKISYLVLTGGLLITSTVSTVLAADNQLSVPQADNRLNSTKSIKEQTFNWLGLDITLDSNGTLHIPGGKVSKPTNDISDSEIAYVLGKDASLVQRITIEGDLDLNPLEEGDYSPAVFSDFPKLVSIEGLSRVNVSKLTGMSWMFAYNPSLTSIDLSGFDTANVISMSYMFAGDYKLANINLKGLNTSNVQSTEKMFLNNKSLSSLDLSSFDTGKMSNKKHMFLDTPNLQVLKLGKNFTFSGEEYLKNHGDINQYTGKWQNVGTGTEISPNGKNVWTSEEFMSNYNGATDADTYVWQPKEVVPVSSKVNITYQNTSGETLAPTQTITGDVGESYDVTNYQKDIKGYTFIEVKGSVTGVFTNEIQTVTYIYTADKEGITPPDKGHNDNSKPNSSHKSDNSVKTKLPKTGEEVAINTAISIIGAMLIVSLTFVISKKKTS